MSIPEAMVRRYFRRYEDDEEFVCDAVWIDRTTGKEVLRYDAADPANTNPDYGAIPDADCFANKGLDINERVAISRCLPDFL